MVDFDFKFSSLKLRASRFGVFSSSSNLLTIWALKPEDASRTLTLRWILQRQSNTYDFQQRLSKNRCVIDSILNNAAKGSVVLLVAFEAHLKTPRYFFKLPQARGKKKRND